MSAVGEGWAQPIASASGSLPPRSPRARIFAGARRSLGTCLVMFGASACTTTPPNVADEASPAAETSIAVATAAPSVTSVSPPLGESGVAPAAPLPTPSHARREPTEAGGGETKAAPTVSLEDPALSRLLALGDGALLREDYTSAIRHFRQARRHSPSHPAPTVGLVSARFGELGIATEYRGAVGNPDVKALLGQLDEAQRVDPNFGPVYLARGRLLVVLGDGTAARVALTTALQMLPRDAESNSLLAIVDLSEGKVEQAVSGFARAAELDPNNPDRLSNWGTALLLHGDVQQAISVFRRAVSLAPNDARARGDLGTALLAISDVTQALPHLERAQQLAPRKATYMSNLGYAHQQLGDLDTAERWYRNAVTTDPQLGSAWINFGTLHAARGKYEAAEQAFRKALALDPEDPRALANLKDLAQVRGR